MTPIELIQETVDYYRVDPKGLRGVNYESRWGGCEYLTIEGKMCAVGRCAKDPYKLQNDFDGGDVSTLVLQMRDMGEEVSLDKYLKDDYQGFPIGLWIDVQDLHDSPSNWDNLGLTQRGRIAHSDLIEKWGDHHEDNS
jgi:hypothetical protein